jgi:serine/threonine protein kinase
MTSSQLLAGNKLASRYRIIDKLGEGSFAETYLAEDEHLPNGYHCVVKKLKTGVEEESRLQIAKRLFDSEAKTLHQLGSHAQIPQLLAHFEENGEFYLVEEYIEGTSLYHELATGQQWSEGYVLNLLQDILEALRFVHYKGHIHRDIKPSNIIRRSRDGKLVLIDFGAVKQVTNQVLDENNHAAHTVIVGTPGYMPSEQLRGNPRMSSDVFAVGMIALYALTGLNPALGQLPEDDQTAEIIWRDRATVSSELAAILDRMVAYDFRQRYPSAQEALDALHSLMLARQNDTPTVVKTDATLGGHDFTAVVAPSGSTAASQYPAPQAVTEISQPPAPFPVQSPGVAPDSFSQPPSVPPELGGNPSQSPLIVNHAALEASAGTYPQSADPGSMNLNAINGGYAGSMQPQTVMAQGSSQSMAPNYGYGAGGSGIGSVTPATQDNRSPLKKIALIGGGALLALTAAVGVASPNLEGFCKVLNNCNAEIKFKTQYTDALEQAKTAKKASTEAKTLKDLESAQVKLQEAVKDLEQIPDSVAAHKDAQKALPEYQKALKDLNAKMTTEKKGEQEFSQGTALMDKVTQEEKTLKDQKKTATLAVLSGQRQKLEEASKLMEKVPAESMAGKQAKAKKQDLQKRLTTLEDAIAKRDAIENPRPVYVPPAPSASSGSDWNSGNAGGNWNSGSSSAAAPAPEPYYPPEPAPAREAPVWGAGSGGGGGGGSYNPPPPAAEEPLWGAGSGGGSDADSGGGGGEPLWGN